MKTKKRKIMGWTFVIPASIMIVIFNFVPMIQSFILSLKRGSGTNMTFTGLSNYKRMFQDKIFKMTLIVSFMNAWNSYMWPLIVLQNENSKTMPILVSGLTARYTIDYGSMMLAVTISTIPMLIIFFVLQKNFVEGITGSVKS